MANKRVVVHAPEEIAAMAICFLTRWHQGERTFIIDVGQERVHNGQCRFCAEPPETLIATVDGYLRDRDNWPAMQDFERLPRAVQAARRKEAQERAWYEGLSL